MSPDLPRISGAATCSALERAGFSFRSQRGSHRKLRQVHACLEATGRYSLGIALALHEAGHTVSVVNPARIHGFAQSQLQRNKTDRLDAALIARFCQQQQPEAWTPPPLEIQQLRALMRRLEALQEMRQQESNRLVP